MRAGRETGPLLFEYASDPDGNLIRRLFTAVQGLGSNAMFDMGVVEDREVQGSSNNAVTVFHPQISQITQI
jgi:hypothetical protein